MVYRRCAVRNCENRDATRHRFPNPEKFMERYNIWVEACQNRELDSLEPQFIYRSYRICHIHFRPEDKSSNMYLIKSAIPTLHLPASKTSVQQIYELSPKYLKPGCSTDIFEAEISRSSTYQLSSTENEMLPSTSSSHFHSMSLTTPPRAQKRNLEIDDSSYKRDILPTPKKYNHTANFQEPNVAAAKRQALEMKLRPRLQTVNYVECTDGEIEEAVTEELKIHPTLCTFEEMQEMIAEMEEAKKLLASIDTGELRTIPSFELEDNNEDFIYLDCYHLTISQITRAFKNNIDYLFKELNSKYLSRLTRRSFRINQGPYSFSSFLVFTQKQKTKLAYLLYKTFETIEPMYFKKLMPVICLKIFMDEYQMSRTEANNYLNERPVELSW